MSALKNRELLELAAKAAGLTTRHKYNAERLLFTPPIAALVVFDEKGLVNTGWDPLTENEHALWLAVRLKIDIIHCADGGVRAYTPAGPCVPYGDDPYAATRRAIVLAAVALVQGVQK